MDDVASEVRDLVSQMNAKFARWDMYQTALRKWRVTGEQSTQLCDISADGIVEALRGALAWRALPLVTRPPQVLCRDGFAARKVGRQWQLTYCGQDQHAHFGSKKEAEAAADRAVAYSVSAADSWETMYGWSRGKTEGVDFRWAR